MERIEIFGGYSIGREHLSQTSFKYAGNRKTKHRQINLIENCIFLYGQCDIFSMCGIIGYTGNEKCVPILLSGLEALEYRGYDSAGIALWEGEDLVTVKATGRLARLREKLNTSDALTASCGIGHTRWATHGEPSDRNCHPHSADTLTLVHNGILENYAEIEETLRAAGYEFESDTDTERGAKLLDLFYRGSGDPQDAIRRSCKIMRGSYAFGIMFKDRPNAVWAVRKDSPLIVAKTESGCLLASDIPAILPYTKEYYRLEEGVIAELTPTAIRLWNVEGEECFPLPEEINWDIEQAQKGGYPHFMLKEIYEEPDAIRKTVTPRLRNDLPDFSGDTLDDAHLAGASTIHIVACGTAMHAGLVGKAIIERLARIPVNVEIASEFRYRNPILRPTDPVILLSQSGETADTLAALRHAKAQGLYTLAIANVIGSSVAREADGVLYTRAGPEIAVASTKAYSVQCSLLYLLALRLALIRGLISEQEAASVARRMREDLPRVIEQTLDLNDSILRVAKRLLSAEHIFYIGRDIDWQICIEASLKLKEISYIHSEAYAAGELKHGTISLVTDGVPVIALATAEHVCEKTISGMREVHSRGAYLVALTTPELAKKYQFPCDELLILPPVEEILAPFSAVTALQLLAYHVSALKGLDVDKPRNLAKSVTVE